MIKAAILAKRFWDTYPFFTCFCMEFAANLRYTFVNTALTRILPPPSPMNKVGDLNVCKICKRRLTCNKPTLSMKAGGGGGEGSTLIAISSPETESAPNVLTRVVVPAFLLAFCGFICVPYEHLNKFCAHFVSGQFKHFNRSRKRRPCCSDLFST